MSMKTSIRRTTRALAFGLFALFSAALFADSTIAERIATHELLRDSVEQGTGKYARLGTQDKVRLLREQDRIFTLLRGKSKTSDLSSAERAQLDRAESTVAQIVVQLDVGKPKMVCSYEARVGSNRKERVCKRLDGPFQSRPQAFKPSIRQEAR